MEDNPCLQINTDTGEYTLNRYNSALFTFLGHSATGELLSSRNHVFVRDEGDETGEIRGMYIFSHASHFTEIASWMVSHDFPAHLNMHQVAECDEDAYQSMIDKQIGLEEIPDELPEGFA